MKGRFRKGKKAYKKHLGLKISWNQFILKSRYLKFLRKQEEKHKEAVRSIMMCVQLMQARVQIAHVNSMRRPQDISPEQFRLEKHLRIMQICTDQFEAINSIVTETAPL